MDKYDEIKYRNDLAKMNVNKADILSLKKNMTKQESAKAFKCLVNATYHEFKIKALLDDPVYRNKTDKELYKMAEDDFVEFYRNENSDRNMMRLIDFVKNLFKKKDKR